MPRAKSQQEEFAKITARLNESRDKSKAELDAWKHKQLADLELREARDLAAHEQKSSDELRSDRVDLHNRTDQVWRKAGPTV